MQIFQYGNKYLYIISHDIISYLIYHIKYQLIDLFTISESTIILNYFLIFLLVLMLDAVIVIFRILLEIHLHPHF